jgi:diacylglycerol O-acyltransferase
MIPVNIRGDEGVGQLGNRILFMPITIPLDVRDPLKLFAFVRERMEFLKRMRAAEFVGFAGGLFATIPSPIWAAIGPVASQLPLSLCNIIITNVPGPQTPIYLLGHEMLSWYPYVPIGGEMGVNTAILSYNGMAYFGFSCDVGAVPDPENLEKFVSMSFAELCDASKKRKGKAATSSRAKAAPKAKRARPNAAIPVNRNRVRPNTAIPMQHTPKPARKATTAQAEASSAIPVEVSVPKQTPAAEEPKALAVGA